MKNADSLRHAVARLWYRGLDDGGCNMPPVNIGIKTIYNGRPHVDIVLLYDVKANMFLTRDSSDYINDIYELLTPDDVSIFKASRGHHMTFNKSNADADIFVTLIYINYRLGKGRLTK